MDFKVPFVRIRLELGAVGVEHPPTNQLVLNGLLDVRSGKATTAVLR